MKMRVVILSLVVLILGGSLAVAAEFDPAVDGWYIRNWGEQSSFSWDLYRRTYLGVNPTHDCIEAPLDCAFYEIFKNCAQQGNCGGLSLLALALYKYGGYMGFCSPANFYTGDITGHSSGGGTQYDGPDRTDLHEAMNILQARQFSARGIENFVDVVDAGILNDAVAAYNTIEDSLARGDFAVLSIANSFYGDAAHTVIPYKVEPGPPKKIYIWNSNYPYNKDPGHYNGVDNVMTINGKTDWTYSGYSGSGSDGAWCFAIPMSTILPKSRQPLALDIVFDSLMSIFVTGPGCSVSQISDDEGHQLYKTDSDSHRFTSEIETNPTKRLKGAVRWPWFGQGTGGQPEGELYFIRRRGGSTGELNFTITGKDYKAIVGCGGNLVQIDAKSVALARDIIKVSDLGTAAQSLELQTQATERDLTVKQLRSDLQTRDWRSIEVKNLRAASSLPLKIQAVGDLEALVVSSRDTAVNFDVDMQQRMNGRLTSGSARGLSTTPGKFLKVAPKSWQTLESAGLEKRVLDKLALAPRVAETRLDLSALLNKAPTDVSDLSNTTTTPKTVERTTPTNRTVDVGGYSPMASLEYKLEGASLVSSAVRGTPPPEGYRYLVVSLSLRNPQTSDVNYDESDYVVHLYTAGGEEVRWNGVFLASDADTGISLVKLRPGERIGLRAYFTIPNSTRLGKFVFATKDGSRSYAHELTAE